MAGSFGAMLYMWTRYGKPDASMSGNGLLAGLVAITAPSGFVNTVGAVILGLIAWSVGLRSPWIVRARRVPPETAGALLREDLEQRQPKSCMQEPSA